MSGKFVTAIAAALVMASAGLSAVDPAAAQIRRQVGGGQSMHVSVASFQWRPLRASPSPCTAGRRTCPALRRLEPLRRPALRRAPLHRAALRREAISPRRITARRAGLPAPRVRSAAERRGIVTGDSGRRVSVAALSAGPGRCSGLTPTTTFSTTRSGRMATGPTTICSGPMAMTICSPGSCCPTTTPATITIRRSATRAGGAGSAAGRAGRGVFGRSDLRIGAIDRRRDSDRRDRQGRPTDFGSEREARRAEERRGGRPKGAQRFVRAQTALTAVGRLDAVQTRLQAMIQAADTVRAPLGDFYSSLTDEQKAAFNNLGQTQQATKQGAAGQTSLARLCGPNNAVPVIATDQIDKAVQPDAKQRAALLALRDAATKADDAILASLSVASAADAARTARRGPRPTPGDAERVGIVRPALQDFYASLSDEQKARFDALTLPRRRARRPRRRRNREPRSRRRAPLPLAGNVGEGPSEFPRRRRDT